MTASRADLRVVKSEKTHTSLPPVSTERNRLIRLATHVATNLDKHGLLVQQLTPEQQVERRQTAEVPQFEINTYAIVDSPDSALPSGYGSVRIDAKRAVLTRKGRGIFASAEEPLFMIQHGLFAAVETDYPSLARGLAVLVEVTAYPGAAKRARILRQINESRTLAPTDKERLNALVPQIKVDPNVKAHVARLLSPAAQLLKMQLDDISAVCESIDASRGDTPTVTTLEGRYRTIQMDSNALDHFESEMVDLSRPHLRAVESPSTPMATITPLGGRTLAGPTLG